MKGFAHWFLAGLMVFSPARFAGGENEGLWQRRWVFLRANLLHSEELPRIEGILDRATACGFNGVLLSDPKTAFWWKLEEDSKRWRANAVALRKMLAERGMDLALSVFPFGYSSPILWHDPDLAEGMPVRDAPMRWEDGVFMPLTTARFRNGSIEQFEGETVTGAKIQDGPGKISFIDREIFHEGAASLRIENPGRARHGNGRLCFRLTVRPWQQYRVRFWLKTEELEGGLVQALAIAANSGRELLSQSLRRADAAGNPEALNNTDGLTFDWTEQLVTFNSLGHHEIDFYVGIWEGNRGKLWIDALGIESVPTLNLLRRDSLPIRLVSDDGRQWVEGVDFQPLRDSRMGKNSWPGDFGIRHQAPVIRTRAGSGRKPGAMAFFSGYHAVLTEDGQVAASLLEERVFEICRQELKQAMTVLSPDVVFMGHDEIRSGGWEPQALADFETAGAMLAENIRRCQDIAREVAPGKTVMVWSDMFDPHHNARRDYYLVNNTWEGSWEGLAPETIVMNWNDDDARESLRFFAARGHTQMIAAFYDGDVRENHALWSRAIGGIPNLAGVLYTTWEEDFSKLEAFAAEWWGG